MSSINPFGPVAGAFCLDRSEFATIMGPVGSAKSTAAAMRIMNTAAEQSVGPNGVARSRFAIVRNTNRMLLDTTLKTWLELFPEKQWGNFERVRMTHRIRASINGKPVDAEFQFRPLESEDDIRNLLSAEYTGIWFNEFREIDPAIIPHAMARCGRYPSAGAGGCTWHGIIGDTNPWAFTSEYHKWFVTQQRDGYKFFKQPGGMDEDAENLHNLAQTSTTARLAWDDPVRRAQGRTYYEKLIRDYSPNDADMYVHCKYGASRTGKPVFASYNDNAHIREFAYDKNAPILIGYDCTGRNPAAIVAQKTDAGQWRILAELCEEAMGMVQHAAELARYISSEFPEAQIAKITADPAGKTAEANDLNMLQVIRSKFPGVLVLPARTNDPATRIEAVDGTFRRLVNGEPAILIHPRCKILREACISAYHYRKLKLAGKERHAEEPDKNHPFSDVADALEYLMLGGGEGRVELAAPGARDWAVGGKAVRPSGIWTPFDA